METRPRVFVEAQYERAAQDYLRRLPLEHFMEATPQATQRAITLASLALVHARRLDFQVFNELLVQYPHPTRQRRRPQQVVPDNMVVLSDQPVQAESSFNTPLEPCGPFWVFEYVSKNNWRKDYEDSMVKYEHELKVPYYLLFLAEEQELTLYRHNGTKYVSVPPDENGRHGVPEVEMEIGLHEGWVRYWHRGELLPLPAEMQRELDDARRQLVEAKRQVQNEAKRADGEARMRQAAEAEVERLRREIEALRKRNE